MGYTNDELNDVYDKTNGECHICYGRISFSRYGDVCHARGWEVDHSFAKANGGTDHLNNLWPAHPTCNRSKGKKSIRSVRSHSDESEISPIATALRFLLGMAFGYLVIRIFSQGSQQNAYLSNNPENKRGEE